MEGKKRTLLLLSVIWIIYAPAQGLYAYDCGDQLSNLTTISLLGVGECNINQPIVNVTKTYGQLLQLNDFGLVRTFKCSIKITRIITHCGMHSHVSRVFGGEISYFKEISRDECWRVHQTGHLAIAGTQIDGIKGNNTVHKSIVFAGNSDHSGQCEGGYYSDPYGNYKDVYVAGWIEINLQDAYREVHLEANKIRLTSGVICTFSETQCMDEDAGYVFWSPLPEDACGLTKYTTLFEGKIDKIYETEANKVLYSLETEDITFALWKKGEQNVCGFKFFRTEHPKLFILEDTHDNNFLNRPAVATANLDLFAYINSKFLYVEKHVRKQLNRLYYDILQHKCELERQILANALSLATISPEEVAYNIMGEPGYLAVTAGEVIHLLKCLRVEVIRRNTKDCYDQLPVFRGNEEFFLAPRTHILLRTGRQIPCDRTLPAMYRINKTWFKMLPEALEVKDPEILKPETKPTWRYVSPEALAMGGIYNQKDTNRLRDMILFPVEKPSILNKVALGISGREINTQGITLSKLLDQETISHIAHSAWSKMWVTFLSFGTASAGIIGFILICRLIKLLADTIIHGYAIYSLYGFSIHLVGAIWNSVTQLLLHLGQQDKKNNNNKNINNEGEDYEEVEKNIENKKTINERKKQVPPIYENISEKPSKVYPNLNQEMEDKHKTI